MFWISLPIARVDRSSRFICIDVAALVLSLTIGYEPGFKFKAT